MTSYTDVYKNYEVVKVDSIDGFNKKVDDKIKYLYPGVREW